VQASRLHYETAIMSTITTLALALLLAQTSSSKDQRPRHPLAPSLPVLTEAETARYEAVVERFIEYDIGKSKLSKAQGEKAKEDLMRLGPEAIFVLVEAFNRAANMEHSCPAVVIGRKIASILRSTDDVDLLNFAKDTIGSEVKARRHMGVVKDLQVTCILRKGYLQNQKLAAAKTPRQADAAVPLPNSLSVMAQADLLTAVKTEYGAKLQSLLAEADRRKLFDVLIIAAARPETEAKEMGQSYVDKHLDQKTGAQLKELFKHSQAEARAAAAKAAGRRGLHCEKELIELLSDDNSMVEQAAHRALVQLARGPDFGPAPEATADERAAATRRWREWLAKLAK
jgi:hypothetical protein